MSKFKDSGTHSYLGFLRRNSAFRKLWLAQLTSQTGNRASMVALLGLVLGLTGSGFLASLVLAANMLSPFMVFPFVSTIVDRFDRKRIMVCADLLAVGMALAMMLVNSAARIWIGIAATLGIAAMNAFSRPAAQAALPNLVDDEHLGRANVLLASIQGITLGIGPLIGGVVAAYVGYDAVFGVNALSFVLSAGLVMRITGRFAEDRSEAAVSRPLGAVRQGVSYARSNPRVGALLSIKSAFALAGGGAFVLLPIFAVKVFDAGDLGIGILTAARGLGALLGPFAARAVIGESQPRLFATIGSCAALFGGAYIAFTAIPQIWFALPLVTLAHTGGFALWAMQGYGLQLVTRDQLRGRVFTLDYTLATAMMGISMLVTGQVLTAVGPRVVMAGEAVALVVCAAAWVLTTHRLWRGGLRGTAEGGLAGGSGAS